MDKAESPDLRDTMQCDELERYEGRGEGIEPAVAAGGRLDGRLVGHVHRKNGGQVRVRYAPESRHWIPT